MRDSNLFFSKAIELLKANGGIIGNDEYPNIKLFLKDGWLYSDNNFNPKEHIFSEYKIINSQQWYWEPEPEEKEYVLKKSELNKIIDTATANLGKKDKDEVIAIVKEEASKFKVKQRGE